MKRRTNSSVRARIRPGSSLSAKKAVEAFDPRRLARHPHEERGRAQEEQRHHDHGVAVKLRHGREGQRQEDEHDHHQARR
jgi:hypothetical protein